LAPALARGGDTADALDLGDDDAAERPDDEEEEEEEEDGDDRAVDDEDEPRSRERDEDEVRVVPDTAPRADAGEFHVSGRRSPPKPQNTGLGGSTRVRGCTNTGTATGTWTTCVVRSGGTSTY